MLLAVGVLAALLEAKGSGRGQVVDAAMVDGAGLLMTFIWGMRAVGIWHDRRSSNPLDGAAPYYRAYECADGRYLAVGAMEPQFYRQLVELTGALDEGPLPEQLDESTWAEVGARFERIFRTRSRDEWCKLADGIDACIAPVLDFDESPRHPHNVARGNYVEVGGFVQPAPAPRFGRTPAAVSRPVALPGDDTDDILADWLERSPEDIRELRTAGTVS